MTFGALVLRKHPSHGSSLTVEEKLLKSECITQLHYAKLEVQQVWWFALVVEQQTRVAYTTPGALEDTEMEDGTGWRLLTKVKLKDLFQDTNILHFSWVHWWWSLVVEPTKLVKWFHLKSTILSLPNGTNLTQFKDSDILAGLLVTISMSMVVLNMKFQISHWVKSTKLIHKDFLPDMTTFYRR